MYRFCSFILIILLSVSSLAQNAAQSAAKVKSREPSTDYGRISLSYLLLDFNQGAFNDILKQAFAAAKVSDKFDDNSTDHRFLQAPVTRQETDQAFLMNPHQGSNITDKIGKALKEGHYANDVVAKWFSRKADGSFGVELLQQRGLYNATDAEVKAAGASKLGSAKLMDAGEQLLNKSYILLFDVSDLITKDEDYNRQQKYSKTPLQRTMNGFVANVNAYLFKVDFNDTINAVFWQQLWADANDPALQAKKQAFDRYDFPISYVYRVSNRVEATQYNPGQVLSPKVQATQKELLQKLITQGASNDIFSIERALEDFRVKTVIFGTSPLTAKIGKKEGLKTDQRYFVFEMEQDKSGKITAKRKGVIRASKHVTDNRQMATGVTVPSKFYQVAGHHLDQGMLLQQRNDIGLALSIGASSGGIGGFDGRLDINISRLIGAKMPSMIKLYIEGGYDPLKADLYLDGAETTVTYTDFTRFEGGIGKEFCFLHNFRLQPFAGAGLDKATQKDDSKMTLSALYGHAGVTLGINLLHNFQLVGTYGIFAPFGDITDKDNKKVTVNGSDPETDSWSNGWGHSGTTMNFGVRLEF